MQNSDVSKLNLHSYPDDRISIWRQGFSEEKVPGGKEIVPGGIDDPQQGNIAQVFHLL